MQDFLKSFDGAMDSIKAGFKAFLEPKSFVFDVFSNQWTGIVLSGIIFLIFIIAGAIKYKGEFADKIRKPKTLAICGILIAINAVLGFCSIDISAYLRITFGFITLPVAATVFGPVIASIVGVLQDIITLVVKPTGGLLIALTLNEGISGAMYGMMLYKKKITFLRVLVTEFFVLIFVNGILNSIGLAPIVGSGLIGIFPSRIIKEIILLPIQAIVIYFILKTVEKRVKL